MSTRRWTGLMVAGLLGTLGLAAGCNERQQEKVNENARQVGQEVGEAATQVEEGAKEAAKDMREAGHEAAQGYREGTGGSGDAREREEQKADERSGDGPDIGRNPGVIHDGEGPLEENDRR